MLRNGHHIGKCQPNRTEPLNCEESQKEEIIWEWRERVGEEAGQTVAVRKRKKKMHKNQRTAKRNVT